MKVTGVSMVQNEADVIEAFVRHHADVFDEPVVIDHRSTDGTVLDPVGAEFELRYAVPPEPAPVTILAAPAEQLAEELSDALNGAARRRRG